MNRDNKELGLDKLFPNVKKYDESLFNDYCHHMLVMEQISKKMNVPVKELMDFFYKGKIKSDLIEREEKEYVRQSDNIMPKVSKDNGCD